MSKKLDAEQRLAEKSVLYTRRTYQASLSSGQNVIEILDGNLVETCANGDVRILKKAPPTHRVPVGMKLKVT